ncbi:MAG TPA: ZIP family metal transporter [Devosia sp.]|jgi:ZIP family zinc transporter|uniref:ZIP family metal transporter n=1 Tax=Devosia sp. TaxID=1871048 RepID=UPI002F944A4D
MSELWTFLLIAGGAALASLIGGVASLLVRPTSLLLSIAVGFAGGVLLGAVSFEMVPKALELAGLLTSLIAIAVGVLLVWCFDLFVNRGLTAGEQASQRRWVRRFHQRRKPHGNKVTVIAGATSAEELIEGIVIGASSAIGGGTGLVVGVAIALDNISEALSIGELVFDTDKEKSKRAQRWEIIKWTGLIGISLFVSALGGYFLLSNLPEFWQGTLTAVGAGAMFYLATTGLVPEAESHQFEKSAGLAAALGFLSMIVLTQFT